MVAAVFALGVITVLIKGAGSLLPEPPTRVARRLAGLAPALLAALVWVELAGPDGVTRFDAKTAGVAAAALLFAVRAPFAVAVVGAAAVAALLRIG
ncbi:MAG TPA: AzlD domain-containing protein [Acidimicrobiales bacterium]|nr:AzlD domain-containing protein [Acidimicrobiales bacterium]